MRARRHPGCTLVTVLACALVALAAGVPPAAAQSAPAGAMRAGAATDNTWTWDLPTGFPTPKVPASNPMSRAKVALGRHLFYDRRLSGNGTFSCATCHKASLQRSVMDWRVRSAPLASGIRGEHGAHEHRFRRC
jgi:cytochrome c peroxidase